MLMGIKLALSNNSTNLSGNYFNLYGDVPVIFLINDYINKGLLSIILFLTTLINYALCLRQQPNMKSEFYYCFLVIYLANLGILLIDDVPIADTVVHSVKFPK
jgi:hypothetical protein